MIPLFLYKYEAFSIRSLQNLKSQVLFFGSPRNFNDPYDCNLYPEIKPLTDDQVEKLREHNLGKPGITPEYAAHFSTISRNVLRETFMRAAIGVLENARESFLNTRGVTCFSESSDNLLLWAHYADKSRGFCLEFDTSKGPVPTEKLTPVAYPPDTPKVDIFDWLLDSNYGDILKLFSTKSAEWSYEREWRAIHMEKDKSFTYDMSCLTGIYFGPRAPQVNIEIACLILGGQNKSVKFFRGSSAARGFKVAFQPFTYTRSVDAPGGVR